MASKVKEICEREISPIIENLGYEVVEVEYAKKIDGMNLSFVIYKEGGVLIEDCELVSKAIDEKLEELNVTDDVAYALNVCSPGLDRPIKNYKDFLRNQGKEVEVSLYSKIDGKKKFVGNIVSYNDEGIELQINDTKVSLAHNKIGNISPVIKF